MIGIPIPDEVDPSQNSREWRVRAEGAARAACVLYDHQDASVWISASLLAHYALEALLKSALLKAGFVITREKQNPERAWGHKLYELADQLASRRSDFPLDDLRDDLKLFTALFDELRFPCIPKGGFDSLGPTDKEPFIRLMSEIQHYAFILPPLNAGVKS
jgi:hypothetical protein